MSTKPEHYDVIVKPLITEKATLAGEANGVVFQVAPDANKPQIKEAVEALFGVKVKAVNTTITKSTISAMVQMPSRMNRPQVIQRRAGTPPSWYRGLSN